MGTYSLRRGDEAEAQRYHGEHEHEPEIKPPSQSRLDDPATDDWADDCMGKPHQQMCFSGIYRVRVPGPMKGAEAYTRAWQTVGQ